MDIMSMLQGLITDPAAPPPSEMPTDPSTLQGLLEDNPQSLLGAPMTNRQRALMGLSRALGNVGSAMAQPRRLSWGQALGAAGGAFTEALPDIQHEKLAEIASRYQLAKMQQDYRTMKLEADNYQAMKDAFDKGTSDAAAGAGEPSIDIGAPGAPAPGGAPAGSPAARGGTDPMITLHGIQYPRSLVGAAVLAGPQEGQKMLQAYTTKVATEGQWVDLTPEERASRTDLTPGRAYQRNTMTGRIQAVDQSGATVNLPPQETGFGRAYGEGQGKQASDLEGKGTATAIANLDLIEHANSVYEATGGSGGDWGTIDQAITKNWVALGLGTEEQAKRVGAADMLQGLTAKAVLDTIGGSLGTGISNADRSSIERMVPQLSQSNQGRRQLIGVLKAIQHRDQTYQRMWMDTKKYSRAPAEVANSWVQFQKDRMDYADSHSIVDEATKYTPDSAEPQPPPTQQEADPTIGTDANPLVPKTQADIDNARPGTVIKVWDQTAGKWKTYRKPVAAQPGAR